MKDYLLQDPSERLANQLVKDKFRSLGILQFPASRLERKEPCLERKALVLLKSHGSVKQSTGTEMKDNIN